MNGHSMGVMMNRLHSDKPFHGCEFSVALASCVRQVEDRYKW